MADEVRYFAMFADDGTRLFTLAADGMPYTVADILNEYPRAIEISAEDQAKFMNGWRRDPATGVLLEPVDTRDMAEMKRARLDEVEQREARALALTADQVIECLETGRSVPQALRDERAAIRTQAGEYRQAIANAETGAELDAITVEFAVTGGDT